nr:uncharacterized protein LOC109757345 [Aegilops tauschii subsp. strangulata]
MQRPLLATEFGAPTGSSGGVVKGRLQQVHDGGHVPKNRGLMLSSHGEGGLGATPRGRLETSRSASNWTPGAGSTGATCDSIGSPSSKGAAAQAAGGGSSGGERGEEDGSTSKPTLEMSLSSSGKGGNGEART